MEFFLLVRIQMVFLITIIIIQNTYLMTEQPTIRFLLSRPHLKEKKVKTAITILMFGSLQLLRKIIKTKKQNIIQTGEASAVKSKKLIPLANHLRYQIQHGHRLHKLKMMVHVFAIEIMTNLGYNQKNKKMKMMENHTLLTFIKMVWAQMQN